VKRRRREKGLSQAAKRVGGKSLGRKTTASTAGYLLGLGKRGRFRLAETEQSAGMKKSSSTSEYPIGEDKRNEKKGNHSPPVTRDDRAE